MVIMKVMHGAQDELDIDAENCECGTIPDFEIAYSSTPFMIHCMNCRTCYANDITNCDGKGAIEHWNNWRKNESENPFNIKGSPF